MRAFKLSALAIAMGLGVTTAQASNVNVPESKGGFNVGIEGNYLRQTNSDLDYAYRYDKSSGKPRAGEQSLHAVDPGHDFGFGVNVGYVFPGTGVDIDLRYNRFSTDDSNSVTADRQNNITVDSLYKVASGVNTYVDSTILTNAGYSGAFNIDKVTGKVDFTLDDFAATLGQKINFCNLSTRLYAGVGYVNVDEELTTTANSKGTFINISTSEASTVTNEVTAKSVSDFSGIGPVIGLNGAYNLYNGFGVLANVEAGLYVGNTDLSYRIDSKVNVPGDAQQTKTHNILNVPKKGENRVVPKLAAELGLQYAHNLNNNYSLAVEGGYKVASYINAKDRLVFNDIQDGNLDDINYHRKTTNQVVDGPFLRVKLLAA